MSASWWKVLGCGIGGVALAALILYIVLDVYEVGGVAMPRPEPIKPGNVTRLAADQGWPAGWKPGQAEWFHHASQGTRVLPYDWFMNLEQPSLSPFHDPGKVVDGGYLQRFGFLPGDADPAFNPGGKLPIGFAIEEHFDAPYANPPSTGRVVGLTCAACHTGQVTYRDGGVLKAIRIEGGSAMINLAAFQEALGRSLAFTELIDTRFARFARRVLGDRPSDEAQKALRKQLQDFIRVGLETREYSRVHKLNGTEGGFSRTDALGLIGNRVFSGIDVENQIVTDAPVNFPPLWDTPWFDWVQYNASIRMPMVRNIGEALGVGAAVNLDPRRGRLYESTVNVASIHLLEAQLGGATVFAGLQPPKWPAAAFGEPDPEKSRVGAALYKSRCQSCHLPPRGELEALAGKPGTPEFKEHFFVEPSSGKAILKVKTFDLHRIGTDPNQAMNLYRRVAVSRGETISATRGLFAVTEFIRRDKYQGLSPSQALVWNRFRGFAEGTPQDVEAGKFIDEVLKANLKYKARPLDGIWATPPYLHNSSVPNLHQLLLPVAARDATFHLGSTLYDRDRMGLATEEFPGAFLMDTALPGNRNTGHEFRNLTLDEFETITEYGLRPGPTDRVRDRWNRVLSAALHKPAAEFAALADDRLREPIRAATDAALALPRIVQDHPFPGVLGPEFTEAERANLLDYLKSL